MHHRGDLVYLGVQANSRASGPHTVSLNYKILAVENFKLEACFFLKAFS